MSQFATRFPIYQVASISEFEGLFGRIAQHEIVKAARFPCLVIELLIDRDEIEVLEQLSEMGFVLLEDTEISIDLFQYFNKKRQINRAFLFVSEDEVERLESLSGEMPLLNEILKSASLSAKNFLEPISQVKIGGKNFDTSHCPLIMGVINVTPDSFYGISRVYSVKTALEVAREMIEHGADIIDVGGQSTRPGSQPISQAEEFERVIPVIRAIASNLDVLISVDTYRPHVAEESLSAGAHIINDINGFRAQGMLELLAKKRVPAILMHMKGESPMTMQENPQYDDVVAEIFAFFNDRLKALDDEGGDPNQVIIDPGLGFGKRYEDNLDILARSSSFASFGLPVLVGHSRKSFIGTALGGLPPEERLEGTIAAGAISTFLGVSIIRVHDPLEAKRAARVASELRKRKRVF